MAKAIDLTGHVFEDLTVIERADCPPEYTRPRVSWLCQCKCGKRKVYIADSLRTGLVKSCGCRNQSVEFREAAGSLHRRHGMTGTPTWTSWAKMIQRCTNPKSIQYKWYGARSISVCERWLVFENFFEDMGVRPHGLTLDRKNNDLGYSQSNCRWATPKEQAANRRATTKRAEPSGLH